MSVGSVKPLTTRDWVKPCGKVVAPWADPIDKTSKVPKEASNATVIVANRRCIDFLILHTFP
jgi:hypothetical protein